MMKGGSIWARLSLAVVVIVCIAWGLLGAGMLLVLRADRDFRALAEDSIPRVALAGELAEFTGELAALSTRIVAASQHPDADLEAAPDIAGTAAGIEALLAAPALRDAPQGRALAAAQAELRASLAGFSGVSAELAAARIQAREIEHQLRWTQGDVQDQAGALLQDLSFNMDAQLGVLVADPDPGRRAAAEALLKLERQLRDRLQRLATETATLTAILLQAWSAADMATLDQAEQLGHDTLDTIGLLRTGLPGTVDITLFLQGADRLVALAQEPDGVFAQMRRQIGLRAEALDYLNRAQAALGEMQAELSQLGRAERLAAQAAADGAARRVFAGAAGLSVLVVAGALAGAAILLLFVRNRIVRRIHALSDDLTRIAAGDISGGEAASAAGHGRDEIADMARAVDVFRDSVAGLQAAHRDLSAEVAERRRAVERLELTQRELVQAGKMAALGQMSAAISHEINQPLAAMRHRLHTLALAHPEAREPIARIEATVERITATIAHLRRIARRSDHRMARVRLAEPVEAALALLDHRLRAGGVTVDRDPALAALEVEGDEILLEQVMLNILGNALDAIAETGRGHGAIRMVATEGEDIALSVTDDGVGLRGHRPADLVDPFFTTKEVGKGLGLGLSIAFNVMQDMGGRLAIGPAGDGGAEVRLRLRRWQGAERMAAHG